MLSRFSDSKRRKFAKQIGRPAAHNTNEQTDKGPVIFLKIKTNCVHNIFQITESMVGQQYSPDQRNVLALEYHKVKGTYKCFSKVMDIFATKFPGVRLPTKETVKNIWRKQKTHFTVHNLNSRHSPGNSYSGRRRFLRIDLIIQAVNNILDAVSVEDADTPT